MSRSITVMEAGTSDNGWASRVADSTTGSS